MLEVLVKILFIFLICVGYPFVGVKIAEMFDEIENDRYIFLWPVVLWWLFVTITEDAEWRIWLRSIWYRITEPFYPDDEIDE